MSDNLEQDGRVESFFNVGTLTEEKDLVITKVLEGVLEKLREVAKVSNEMLGFKSLREATEGVLKLEKSVASLNQEKLKALDITYKEIKVRREAAAAETLEEQAHLRRLQQQKALQSINKTNNKTTTTNGQTQPAPGQTPTSPIIEQKGDDIRQTEARVESLKQRFLELSEAKAKYVREGNTKTAGFYDASRDIKLVEAELERENQVLADQKIELQLIEADYQKLIVLKKEFASLPVADQKSNAGRGVRVQIEQAEKLANPAFQPTLPVGDQDVQKKIADINDFKGVLADIEAKMQEVRGTPLFDQLSADAEQYKAEIKGMTEDLGLFVAGAERVDATGAFKNFNQELKAAQQKLADLKVANVTGPELDRAIADLERLQAKGKEVKETLKGVTTAAGGPGAGGGGSIDLGPYDELILKARQAKKEFLDLREAQKQSGSGISTADIDAARAKWLGFQNQVRDASLQMKDALKANPNADLQKQVADITRVIQNASTQAASLRYQMDQVGKTQVGRNSPQFKQLSQDLDGFDKKIVDSFNRLKKLSPEAAAALQRNIPIPKLSAGGSAATFDKEIRAAEVLNSTYEALQTQLLALQAEAQELASRQFLGIATPDEVGRLGHLTVQIDELSQGIVKIDNTLGRAGRNNMAYTRQLFSLQQVLRETPSLAFGWSTFISAISNNLPILADDIKRIKDENKRLAESGIKTKGVWASLAESFFSWQTLLLLGISVLAIYADEIGHFVVELFRTEEANKRAYAASKQFADLQDKISASIKTLTKSYEELNNIRNRSNEQGLRNLNNELKALQALGMTADHYFSKRQEIADLESRISGDKKTATIGGISKQIDLNNQTKGKDRIDEIGFLETSIKDQKTKQQPTQVKTDLRGNEVVERVNTVKDIARAKELEERFKKQQQLAKNEVALDRELEDLDKQRKERMLKVQEDFEQGRIDAHERANRELLIKDEFLLKAGIVGNNKSAAIKERQQFTEQVVIDEGARVKTERADPEKDKQFKAAQKNAEAAKKDAESATEFVKQVTDAENDAADAITKQQELANEKAKFNSDQLKQKRIADAQAYADKVKAINEDILADETTSQQKRLQATDNIAKAQSRLNLVTVSEARRQAARGDITGADLFEAEKRFGVAEQQLEIETTRKKLDIRYSYLQRRLAAEKKELESERNLSIKINSDIQKAEAVTLQERLRSQQSVFTSRKKLLEEQLRQELVLAGFNDQAKPGQRDSEVDTFMKTGEVEIAGKRKTQEELYAIRAEFENKMLELVRDAAIEQNDAIKAELNRQEGLYSEAIKNIQRQYEEADLGKLISYTADVTALNNSFILGEALFKNYASRRKAIDEDYQRKALKSEIKSLDDQIAEAKKHYSAEEEAAANHAVHMAEIRLSIAESRSAATPEGSEARKAADAEVDAANRSLSAARSLRDGIAAYGAQITKLVKERVSKIKDLSDEEAGIIAGEVAKIVAQFVKIGAALAQLQDARYNARAQQIQDEMDLLDKRTEKERSSIEQTVLSEEERAKRLRELDVRSSQQKEVLDKKQRRLEFDRAKAQKTAALFNVGVDLATTLANIKFSAFKGFASPNLFDKIQAALALAQIPLAIAAAAASTAAINATPLPKYALGTEDHPGGKAVLGDAYRSELVQEPSGKMWITAARPTVYDVVEHARVFPDAKKELQKMVVPSVQPMATIREVEKQDYTATLQRHVDNARQASTAGGSMALVLPPLMRPLSVVKPMEHSMYTHTTVERLVQAPAPDVSVNVTGMEQLPGILNKGFERVVSALKNQPQPTPTGSRNAELLLKYGSDYYKYL